MLFITTDLKQGHPQQIPQYHIKHLYIMRTQIEILNKSTKYKQVERLQFTLQMIANLQVLINSEREVCKSIFGEDKEGRVMVTGNSALRIKRYSKLVNYLMGRYNKQVSTFKPKQ